MKKNQQGNVMAVLLAVLVLAFIVWVGFYIRDHHHDNGSASITHLGKAGSTSSGLSNGTDDQSLNSDLQNINNGLNQSNQNLQSANSGINDQQLPISE